MRRSGAARHERGASRSRCAFVSDDGFTILCGRNNLQNDRLTLKDSRKNDIWLHTQKIPGSHVVIVTQGQEVPDRTLEQAAVIAAYHSKARESGKVAVDYTQVRNVWKHPSGRPGLVLYEPYRLPLLNRTPRLRTGCLKNARTIVASAKKRGPNRAAFFNKN